MKSPRPTGRHPGRLPRAPPLARGGPAVIYTPLHGGRGSADAAGHPAGRVPRPARWWPRRPSRTPRSQRALPYRRNAALDLALAEARETGHRSGLASDPDGDRLAVAVPDPGAAAAGALSPGPARRAARRVRARRLRAGTLEPGPSSRDPRGRTLEPGPRGRGPRDQGERGQRDPRERLAASTVVSSSLLSRSPPQPACSTRRRLPGSSGSSGPRTTDQGRGSYSDTKKHSVTRSATCAGQRRDQRRLAMLGSRRRPGQPGIGAGPVGCTGDGARVHLTAQLTLPPGSGRSWPGAGARHGLGGSPARGDRTWRRAGAAAPDALIIRWTTPGGAAAQRHRTQAQGLPRSHRAGRGGWPGGARRSAAARMAPLRAAVGARLAAPR